MKSFIPLFVLFLLSGICIGQDTIFICNPSFEGKPKRSRVPKEWYDVGTKEFPEMSPPDLQPIKDWGKSPKPSDGRSYVGMVTRYNDTWECISQKLTKPLMKDSCYAVSIDLCRGKEYSSPTNRNREKKEDFTESIVLRVWLSNKPFEADQLVYTSKEVDYSDWKTNSFQFQPDQDYKFIHLQSFYHVPVLLPYNGHIMMDNMSHLVRVPCK